jgi:hypothetical protein
MKTRWKLLIGVLLIFGVVFLLIKTARESGFREGYAPVQPINFSHKIHAGDNKISCQYCHFAADKGRHAGIPPTALCMNCHNKIKKDSVEIIKVKEAVTSKNNIKWTRVHNLPDYAYFNHSQHVRVGKVSCQTCHGKVEGMTRLTQVKPMNMGWCIDCHREKEISPPQDHKSATGGDCARCHY